MKKDHFLVKGMSCAACQARVNKAVSELEGVSECNVNLLTNSMDVTYDETITNCEIIKKAVKDAGYAASLAKNREKLQKTGHPLIKLIICLVLTIILMYVSMGHMVHLPVPDLFVNHEYAIYHLLIQFALTIPIMVIYNHYFISGFKKLFKAPNMDSLIALGASMSFIYSIFALVMIIIGIKKGDVSLVEKYHHNIYLDSVAMILTLVSLGKYIEDLSKQKTTKAIESLVDLSPKTARLLNEEIVPAQDIKAGDIVIVKMGETIPVDGIIIEGDGSIEESNLTGESLPVYKTIDNDVYASTILKSGYLKIKATKNGDDTSFNTIIKLVEEASNSKAPISKLVDKISLYFVPIIIAIALITFGVHLTINLINQVSNAFEIAFNYGVSVLVVACPCALGLATPVAIMVGTGKGAKLGLIIKNAEILELAGKIDTIVLDKTGTLTSGHPVVSDVFIKDNEEKILSIVNSIESLSHHPLSLAINEYVSKRNLSSVDVTDYQMIEGQGLTAKYKNDTYKIGNVRFLGSNIPQDILDIFNKSILEGKTALFIIKNDNVIGLINIKDELREDAIEAINYLKELHIDVTMLTGDKKETGEAIASKLGITNVISEVLPVDKGQQIELLKDKHTVAMVGDGVNDALALTKADVGIAISGGSDAAIENSDIILISKRLMDIGNAIKLSRRVMTTIKIALFWAFFYNCIGVILAAGVIPSITLNPMICSLAMSFSSVFVVLTALSINLFKKK